MKIICTGDLHITNKVPRNRKKGYFNQVINKFEQILEITEAKTDSNILLVAGDFFDSPSVPYDVTREIISKIKKYAVDILAVPGQHDQRWHTSGLDNTPLGVLSESEHIKILSNKELFYLGESVTVIGAGWNEEPQKEADIVVTHQMVTKKGELWPGQTNYSTAHAIMRKYPWARCVVSGDNHIPHSLRLKSGRMQINTGCMMRNTKALIDFEPRVYMVDTSNWKAKAVYLEIEKPEDIFDFEKIGMDEIKEEIKNEASEKIAKFVASLPQNMQDRPNFKLILQSLVERSKPSKKVQEIINDTMERVS